MTVRAVAEHGRQVGGTPVPNQAAAAMEQVTAPRADAEVAEQERASEQTAPSVDIVANLKERGSNDDATNEGLKRVRGCRIHATAPRTCFGSTIAREALKSHMASCLFSIPSRYASA